MWTSGIKLGEFAEPRGEPMHADARRRRHLQIAVRPLAAVGQLGARGLELHEDVVRGAKQQVALLGQDQAARVPVEQRNREFLFQRAHLPRHRRLREPELLAGMRKAAGFGGGMKDFELIPIHHRCFLPLRVRGRGEELLGRQARLGLAVCRKEFLGFERRHAAKAGGGDRLAIDIVGDIAGSE